MIAWFDCFSGVSGDMVLGALVDAGWPYDRLRELPAMLGMDGVDIGVSHVVRNSIRAVSVQVTSRQEQRLRTLPVIQDMLAASALPEPVRQRVLDIFTIIAEAEAHVHGCEVEHVHFHEVGAVDTVVDIAGTVTGLYDLGVETCHCSALPMSSGFVECSHGILPVPAPAVAKIVEGLPVSGIDVKAELVTPTGAALMKGLCSSFGPMPAMEVRHVGYGAGDEGCSDIPDLLRVWIGKGLDSMHSRVVTLTTCIDDMNPEWFSHVMERLFEAGALDVFIRPVYMKKGRPGNELVVICPLGQEEGLASVIFSETTTTGIRFDHQSRYLLPRHTGYVSTRWGRLQVKVIERPGGIREVVPEYEECRRVAREQGVALWRVYQEVRQLGSDSGAVEFKL